MKEIERHIESLLLRNDCVIVPDLGGFVAHHVDARYSEEECLFLPPTRMLGFNPQLTMNDSLLVQSYADTYDLSYPEALGRVEQEVAALRSALDEEGHCELEGLGTLYKNQEGKLSFAPCEAGILTPSLYALDSFEVKPLETAAKSEAEEEKTQAVVVTRDEENGQRRVSVSLKAWRCSRWRESRPSPGSSRNSSSSPRLSVADSTCWSSSRWSTRSCRSITTC